MQLLLILTACIVDFGLVSVEAQNQIADQAITSNVNYDSQIQENFQNLFDSMVKHDAEKSGVYRDILKEEVSNKRQAFDEMKKELWTARSKNSNRRRNAYENNYTRGHITVNKRAMYKNPYEDIKDPRERSLPTQQPDCEPHPAADLFYKYHSHRRYKFKHWLCREPFEKRLKICMEVFSKTTNREIRNNYRLMSNIGVEYECEVRTVLYVKPIETSLEIFMLGRDAKPEMCLNIDMYKCPLTKMDIRFKGKEEPPEIYDFYITIGRSLVTIAMLRDSPSGKNICLKDEYYYPKQNQTSTSVGY